MMKTVAIRKLTTLLGAILLLSSGAAYAQDASALPKLPYTDPVYQRIDYLQKMGVLISYPDGFQSGRVPQFTRREFAVSIARALDYRQSPAGKKGNSEYHLSTPQIRAAFRLLAEEFEPELKDLGLSMPYVYAHLAIPEPFSNVPKDHWAAASVERLRKAEIIVGYSDGDF